MWITPSNQIRKKKSTGWTHFLLVFQTKVFPIFAFSASESPRRSTMDVSASLSEMATNRKFKYHIAIFLDIAEAFDNLLVVIS